MNENDFSDELTHYVYAHFPKRNPFRFSPIFMVIFPRIQLIAITLAHTVIAPIARGLDRVTNHIKPLHVLSIIQFIVYSLIATERFICRGR